VLGVPLSRWILENVHGHGLAGWRWVFILEGLPAIVFGVMALFYLTDRIHQAGWLRQDEKQWLMAELAGEENAKIAAGRVRILDAFRDPQRICRSVYLRLFANCDRRLRIRFVVHHRLHAAFRIACNSNPCRKATQE
jgi:MFS family permease